MREIIDEAAALESTTVGVYRTAATVKGGRRFSFAAMVVAGNGEGKAGWGYGKANEVPPSVEKATKQAAREQIEVPILILHGKEDPFFGKSEDAVKQLTEAGVGAKLHPAWRAELGGKLSAVTVAGGVCFVAAIDAHTVHALDAATGERKWQFVAGGRVDSPPTIYGDAVLFGSADGHVYCVRRSDG